MSFVGLVESSWMKAVRSIQVIKQVWVTQDVTEHRKTDVEGVGNKRWEDPNLYMWVKNGESSGAMSAGDVVALDPTEDSTVVKAVATASLSLLAGVIASTTIPFGKYGWVVISGVHTAFVLPHTQATGDHVIGQYLKGVNEKTYAAADETTQPLYKRNLQLLQTVTTHTTPTSGIRTARCLVSCV